MSFFDTAAMYSGGASELRLGELAEGPRTLSLPPSSRQALSGRRTSLPAALDDSLKRLRRRPSRPLPAPLPVAVGGYRQAHGSDGRRRRGQQDPTRLASSNYSAKQMRTGSPQALARRGIPACLQPGPVLAAAPPTRDRRSPRHCEELGVTLIAYQPLASGALTGKYASGLRPKGLRRSQPVFRGGGLHDIQPVLHLLKEIGERHHKSPAQVALRWLIENARVMPIPGAKSGAQATHNAEALTFTLPRPTSKHSAKRRSAGEQATSR